MATLLYGPRLGPPSATSFKVWAGYDGADTITLETAPSASGPWTTADTQAVDTAQQNTVVLEATNLTANTLYHYRITNAAGTSYAAKTRTMRSGTGRFIVYFVNGGRLASVNLAAAPLILQDYEDNYDGLPCFVVNVGDNVSMPELSPIAEAVAFRTMALDLAGLQALFERFPHCMTVDDNDWAGNNSSKDRMPSFNDDEDACRRVHEALFRDRPQPAAPSYGFSVEVSKVPFILPDTHSQRIHGITFQEESTRFIPIWNGTEDPEVFDYLFHGREQAEWLISTLRNYSDRGAVIIGHSNTLRDVTEDEAGGTGSGARHGLAYFYAAERNHVYGQGCLGHGYRERRNLLVFSGDLQKNRAWYTSMGEAVGWSNAAANRPPASIGLPFYEFVCSVGAAAATITYHGTADDPGTLFFETGAGPARTTSCIRFDITSARNGQDVTGRITLLSTEVDPIAAFTDDNGRTGDWWFRNGELATWTGTNADQTYPPDNARTGGTRFERSYVDEITGDLNRESEVVRDHDDILRHFEDVDELGRDDLLEIYEETHRRRDEEEINL